MCRALYETNSYKLHTREQNVCVGVMTSIHPCITGNVEKHYFSALSENTSASSLVDLIILLMFGCFLFSDAGKGPERNRAKENIPLKLKGWDSVFTHKHKDEEK